MPARGVLLECYDRRGNGIITPTSAVAFDPDIVLAPGAVVANILGHTMNIATGEKTRIISRINRRLIFQTRRDGEDAPRRVTLSEIQHFNLECFGKLSNNMIFLYFTTPGMSFHVSYIIESLEGATWEPDRGQCVLVETIAPGSHSVVTLMSRGVVSDVIGCLFMTDALTMPPSRGGPVYGVENQKLAWHKKGPVIGIVLLESAWTGDFTYAVSLWSLLSGLGQVVSRPRSSLIRESHVTLQRIVDETTVHIICGNQAGTGIVVDASAAIIVTCSHVIDNEYAGIQIRHGERLYEGELVYKTAEGKAYDVAVLRVDAPHGFVHQVHFADTPAYIGDTVFVAGFPYLEHHRRQNQTPIIVAGCVTKSTPYVIQTTCYIYAGNSGSPIFRGFQLLGMVASNASSSEQVYPRINFSVPATAFRSSVTRFIATGNRNELNDLESSDVIVQRYWSVGDVKL